MSDSVEGESVPDPTNPRIVATEAVLGGKPRIEGTRLGVRFVHDRIEASEMTPATFADRHDVSVANVYRALAYYHEHPAEMAALRERRERLVTASADDPDVIRGPGDLPEPADGSDE